MAPQNKQNCNRTQDIQPLVPQSLTPARRKVTILYGLSKFIIAAIRHATKLLRCILGHAKRLLGSGNTLGAVKQATEAPVRAEQQEAQGTVVLLETLQNPR